MKTTAERLSESYCLPKTEEEWECLTNLPGLQLISDVTLEQVHLYLNQNRYIGLALVSDKVDFCRPSKKRTEIPVSQFIQLLNDSIVSWRLEDDGFKKTPASHRLQIGDNSVDWLWNHGFAMVAGARGFADFKGIKTYTDLLTIIRLIG